jgi:hypothetical protein
LSQVHAGKIQRSTVGLWLGDTVNLINEDTKALIACSVHINGGAGIFGGLNFNAFFASFYGIIRIASAENQIGMTVGPPIFGQRTRMPSQARRQQIGEQAGERRLALFKDILKTAEAFAK